MISLVKPKPVTVGGARWPVLFTLRAWWELHQVYGSMDAALQAGARIDQAMAARFLWAGLLHDSPDLTIETVTGMLDEADFAELDQLPLALIEAVKVASPVRDDDSDGGTGKPWDWKQARAVWTTEWGRPPEDFWRITFRDFADLSDGRASLYAQASGDGGEQEPIEVTDPRDLIRNQRLRR